MAIQQLTQPIVNPIAAFDSTKEHEITFIVIGGAQVTGNRVVITNNQTGNVVYEKITATMKLAVTIPANTLSNNNYYNVVIYTIDNANNQSDPSTPVPFYCYSQPTLTITNIPATETIGNGTYEFQGNYLQSEGEQLNSYQFILYDSNKDILDRSDIIYYQSNRSLAYTFVGMDNDTSYYVELKGQTVNNTEITSGLIYFTVRYTQPATFAIVDLINDCENGYIQISSNIVAIDGKSNPEPPIYIDDKEVDLRDKDSWVKWDEGFNINNDFTMRVWGRDFNDYEKIISLSNKENTPDNPNKIEMKWMIADVIETLPSYTSVSGKNIAIKNGFKTDIEDLEVMGNSEQISKEPVDLGTGNYIKAETTRDMYLDIQVQGNQYQKTQEGSKQSASGTEVYLTGVDSSKPADITVNGNNYQKINQGIQILQNTNQGTTDWHYSTQSGTGVVAQIDFAGAQGCRFSTSADFSGWKYIWRPPNVDKLKKNTVYTLQLDIRTNYNEQNIYMSIQKADATGRFIDFGEISCNSETKRVKLVATSNDIDITSSHRLYIGIGHLNVVDRTFDISNIILVEGDYSNKDLEWEDYTNLMGSPSPDYPSEIQTVGSVKNILDMSNAKGGTSGGITCNMIADGSYTYKGTASSKAINIWLLGSYNNKTSIFRLEPGTYYIDGVVLFDENNVLANPDTAKIFTFINAHDITGVRALDAVLENTYDETKYPIIAKIDREIPWVPYNYGSVQVNVQNKNYLVNIAQSSVTENGITTTYDGEKFLCKGTTTSGFFGVSKKTNIYLPIGTYTFSQNAISQGRFVLRLYYRDNTFSTHYISVATWRVSFTTSKEAVSFAIFCDSLSSGTNIDYTVYVQLESGRTNTDWIKPEIQQIILPVQQEMLANDYIKRAERHTWKKIVFNGTETLGLSGATTDEILVVAFNISGGKDGYGYSNYFVYSSTVKKNTIAVYNSGKSLRFCVDKNEFPNLEAFKTWLKSKYDSGNPVVVYYQLATPTDLVLTDIQKTAQAQLTNMAIYQDITNITNESSYPAILNVDYNITRAMPSPEAPSEVETVGGNINLYDKNTMIELDGRYRVSSTGNITTNTDYYGLKIPVRPNTQYVTSSNIGYSLWSNLCYFDSDMSFIRGVAYNFQNKVFTTPNNCSFVTIALNKTYDWFKLEEGSVVTTYSPYNQGSVEINIKNKNIMPISSLGTNWEYTSKGIKNRARNAGVTLTTFNIKAGQTIHIGFSILSKPTTDTTFSLYVNGVVGIITGFASIRSYNLNQVYERTYTATKDCNISCRMYGNINKDIFEFQMWTEYDNLTEYTRHEEQSYIMPVQKPMLTGDYISDIEYSGWEKIVIDNTAPLVTEPTQKSGSPRYSIVLSNFIGKIFKNSSTSNEAIAYSNMFPLIQKGATFQSRQGFTIVDSKIYIYDEGESLDAFKQLLTDNPLMVYAQLATSENLPLTTEQQTIQSTLKPAYTDITNIYATEDLPILKASTLRVPSPSVPSPIYSSGDQRNLLEDLGSFDISYTQDYFKVTDTTFKLKPNFVYNLSFDYTINNASTDLYFTVCYKNGNNITDITGSVLYYNQATGRSNTSFMVPEDIPDNSTLSVKFVRTLIPANANVSISNVQLEKGRVAHDYQKHGLYNIYPTAVQKNIFDYDKIYYVENKNTEISYIQNGISANLAGTNETAYIAIGFPNVLQPGQKYAVSYNSYGELLSSKLYTMNKETGERVEEITLNNGSFTAPSNVYDFLFEFTLDDTIENNQVQIWNIQIETGDQVTEYEVYKPNQTTITLDQPLRAIGNYKDIICLESLNLLNPQTQIANVKGGQSYYLSQTGTTQYQLDYLTEYGNLISSVNMASGRITVPDTCVQIRMNASSSDITSNKLQINEGTTSEIYYPYVSEPSVIRYWKSLTLDGVNYGCGSYMFPNGRFIIKDIVNQNDAAQDTIIAEDFGTAYVQRLCCTHLPVVSLAAELNNNLMGVCLGVAAPQISVKFDNATQDTNTWTPQTINAYLKGQYETKIPFVINYVLKNPLVEPLSSENISALKGLKTYEGTSNVFTNNNMPANINFSYISGQSEQEAKNAYVTLKCWNGNVMPYFVHSNYIDIPKETDKVFIWVRKKNNMFDLKIENLGDYQGEET
mgnify:CR=1 FL=1